MLLNQLDEERKTFVRNLINTRTIKIKNERGEQEEVSRRIVKVKRRAAPGIQSMVGGVLAPNPRLLPNPSQQ